MLFLLYTLCLIAASVGADACVCADAEQVPVRSEPCGSVVYKLHTFGACWEETGQQAACDNTQWTEVHYGPDKTGWIDDSDLVNEDSEKCSGSGGSCEDVVFVSRDEWGARPPRFITPFEPPMSMVFVHHTAMVPCFTAEECEDMARQVQDLHMDGNGWDDVGYSFMVGQDGRVYEGRGWLNQPAQARGHNSYSYGVVIMGDFTSVLPVKEAEQAVKDIIDCGIREGYVTVGHEEFGHRDGVCTECPGNLFYPQLQTWLSYSFRDIPVNC